MSSVRLFHFEIQIDLNFFFSSRERARRYAVQSTSNLSARILINDKVIANTTNMLVTLLFRSFSLLEFSLLDPCQMISKVNSIKSFHVISFEHRIRSNWKFMKQQIVLVS